MGKRRKESEEPLVPEQDRRICGGICLCQMTFVLSTVALIYLTVAVYVPSVKTFLYGLEEYPVMCQTINNTYDKSCATWTSCSEWCLTKASGGCPQLHVTTRQNGTHMTLHNCKVVSNTSCPMATTEGLEKINCNNESLRLCTNLTGVYSCKNGHCKNISTVFQCTEEPEGIVINSHLDNLKLQGYFKCHNATCQRYEKELHCDRYCRHIQTTGVNVYLRQEDTVLGVFCDFGYAHTASQGSMPSEPLDEPERFWGASDGTLLTSCFSIEFLNETTIEGTDCLNGTLVNDATFSEPSINFTIFWKIYDNSSQPVDPSHRFLPNQHELTIYNNSKLYINLDGCVNTLKGECQEFFNTHGNDGDNNTAQSRFPCFFHKEDSSLIVTRFDIVRTWWQLIVGFTVPVILFIASLISLLVIGHTVRVGDDTKMRCDGCQESRHETEELAMSPREDGAGVSTIT